jgi:hypothetical protein
MRSIVVPSSNFIEHTKPSNPPNGLRIQRVSHSSASRGVCRAIAGGNSAAVRFESARSAERLLLNSPAAIALVLSSFFQIFGLRAKIWKNEEDITMQVLLQQPCP